MTYAEIRRKFVEFFEGQDHLHLPSSSLIPHNDPSLLFTNAGMNQFKDVFTGKDQRNEKRAVTIQKCIRAGGKHNDLENVGFTARHHTFFEMLGNFSFGDYFKSEAITMAWKFLTEELKIPKDRLYVTVYLTDDEAEELWRVEQNIPADRIFRYGEKDNYWRMGQTGPCGPCSEIFYDHNPTGPKIPIDQDEERFVEIWNLVFMQYYEDESGKQTPLPRPSVDTGAGLERIAAALQGHKDNYKSDVFAPIIKKICEYAELPMDWGTLENTPATLSALKVVADHCRAASFLIAEDVLPGNEGRSYVLRRIMRRAIRYARELSSEKSLFPFACVAFIQHMGAFYPELMQKKEFIVKTVLDEEKRFLQTLDKGSELLKTHLSSLTNSGAKKEVSGKMVFQLYDTYGFPTDLTALIAKEAGFTIDEAGFHQFMENAKAKAKAAAKNHTIASEDLHFAQWSQEVAKKHQGTDFIGYERLLCPEAQVLGLSDGEKVVESLQGNGWLITDKTPFYAKGGGQVGDRGAFWKIDHNKEGSPNPTNEEPLGEIKNTIRLNGVSLHAIELHGGSLHQSDKLFLSVESPTRQETANNHSATHLLHAALKEILGDHVKQAGSLVNPQKLRFDFSHHQPVSAAELRQVETLVNQKIAEDLETHAELKTYDDAVAEGAIAMFGEKYDDEVRVISMGSFSKELCGGTHVQRTSQIRLFKIFAETGVSSGVRRIEAITGRSAFIYLNGLAEENKTLRQKLNVSLPNNFLEGLDEQLSAKVESLLEQQATMKKDLARAQSAKVSAKELMAQAEEKIIKGQRGYLLFSKVPISDRKVLSDLVDQVRHGRQNTVAVLMGESDSPSKPIVVGVSKQLSTIHAGQLTKELCRIMDGKGGGRADFSQGSVSGIEQWEEARTYTHDWVQ